MYTYIWVIHIQDSNLIAVADKKQNYAANDDDGSGKKPETCRQEREREREKSLFDKQLKKTTTTTTNQRKKNTDFPLSLSFTAIVFEKISVH